MGGSAGETTKGSAVHGANGPRADEMGVDSRAAREGTDITGGVTMEASDVLWPVERAATALLPTPGSRGIPLIEEAPGSVVPGTTPVLPERGEHNW